MQENTNSMSLAEKRELFLKLHKEKAVQSNDRITPGKRKGKIPVSFMQEQVLNAETAGSYDPDKTRTVCPYLGYIIKGKINISALHKAIQKIVHRQEILRTNYEAIDNRFYQTINDVPDNILKVIDLDNLSEDEKKGETEHITQKRATETFSLFKDQVMLSATLITAEEEHVLFIPTDHIATDGISMGILQLELLALYQSYSLNIPIPLPELPVKYSDYAIWEREKFSGDFLDEKLKYWRQIPDKINNFLPYDHKQETVSFDGGTVPVAILPQITRKLKELCQKNNVTLFTVLYAAFMKLIHIFSGYRFNFSNFVVANRKQRETEMLIGCFIDWQFLIMDFKGNPTFLELLERTKNTLLKVYDNYVPFAQMPETIPIHELRILFQLQSFYDESNNTSEPVTGKQSSHPALGSKDNASMPKAGQQPMLFIPLKIKSPTFALFPIEVLLSEAADTINGTFTYSRSFYKRSTIINLVNDYILLLSQVIKNPEMRLSETNIKPHKSIVL